MKKIMICTNGWIVIGETTQTEKTIVVENAHVIQHGRTTERVSRIDLTGIPINAILDPLSMPEVALTAIMKTLDCAT